jgi:hypothetical protein
MSAEGVTVINPSKVLFILMPQRDRRQLPDRRALGRGGRRAADHASGDALRAHESSLLWAAPLEETASRIEKRILH